MPKEKDHLSNRVSISAALAKRGISAQAQFRTIAALDRLLGSALDIPTAILESIAVRTRAQSKQDLKLLAVRGETDLIKYQQEFSRGVSNDMMARHIGKTANKKRISEKAIEFLLQADAPEEAPDGDPELEEDWLNCFEDYAENASSERLQTLWARVLAGEIRQPRSFSLATLRFLAEVDQEIAELFERETKHWIDGGFVLMPEDLRGQRLLEITFLEEVGLLQEVSMGFQSSRKPNDEGIVFFREGNYALLLKSNSNISIQAIRITRIGREIIRILPEKNCMETLERMGNRVLSQCQHATIDRIVRVYPGGFRSRAIKTLKEEAK